MIRAALATIARRILREETFDTLVTPALADLHFDATAGRPLRRHYIGLTLVIVAALVRDIRIDIHVTLGARHVWKRTAAWHVAVAAVSVGLMLYAELWLPNGGGASVVARNLVVVAFMIPLPYAMIAAAFYLRRGATVPHRTIAIATVSLALLYTALAGVYHAINYVVAPSEMFSARAVVALATITLFYTFYLSSYAMFGVVLARGRGWTVPLRGFALVVSYLVIQGVLIAVTQWTGTPDNTAIRVFGGTFFNAIAWLLGAHLFRSIAPRLRSAVQ